MRLWFFLLAFLAIVACTTGEKIGGLREGMTPAEVEAVIGRPDGRQRAGNQLGYTYTNRIISGWGMDRTDYYAIFTDGRLSAWGSGDVRQARPNVGTIFVAPFPGTR